LASVHRSSTSRPLPDPGAGIEPAASAFRARRHYQQQLPRSHFIHPFGKEDSNLHRLIQSQGACRLADSRERPAGVEPAYRAWEARAWPIGQGRVDPFRGFRVFGWGVFGRRAGGGLRDRGFEPRSPGWKPGILPLDQSRRSSSMIDVYQRKERELNPQGSSLARVRVGCRRRSACPSVRHRFTSRREDSRIEPYNPTKRNTEDRKRGTRRPNTPHPKTRKPRKGSTEHRREDSNLQSSP
jgi:hypothetical protein